MFQSDTITSGQEIEKLNVEFTATMEQFKSTIQNKVSVDTKEAFVSIWKENLFDFNYQKIMKPLQNTLQE